MYTEYWAAEKLLINKTAIEDAVIFNKYGYLLAHAFDTFNNLFKAFLDSLERVRVSLWVSGAAVHVHTEGRAWSRELGDRNCQ